MAATHLRDEEAIDLGRLQRELVSAIEADRKYSRENDAKFRAVHQKVATYEEFRYVICMCSIRTRPVAMEMHLIHSNSHLLRIR